MGRRLKDNNERITLKSIGLFRWQDDFISENPDFNPSPFCRHAVTEQVKLLIAGGQVDPKWKEFINEERTN